MFLFVFLRFFLSNEVCFLWCSVLKEVCYLELRKELWIISRNKQSQLKCQNFYCPFRITTTTRASIFIFDFTPPRRAFLTLYFLSLRKCCRKFTVTQTFKMCGGRLWKHKEVLMLSFGARSTSPHPIFRKRVSESLTLWF